MKTVLFNNQNVVPSKIVCVGRNFVDHIHELGNAIPDEMVAFNKPNTAISDILHSNFGEQLHYEGEICFVIQHGQLSGVGFGLDLTKRGLQSKLKEKGLPWERAKAFDGAALFSRFVSMDGLVLESLSVELLINGARVQRGNVTQMMYPPQTILQVLNSYTTLDDFDVVMAGTPSGVGEVRSGDVFTGRILHRGEVIVEKEWIAR